MNITAQIIKNKKGKAVAVQIPTARYKKILEMLEELADIKVFDKAMKRKHHFTSFNEAIDRLKAKRKK